MRGGLSAATVAIVLLVGCASESTPPPIPTPRTPAVAKPTSPPPSVAEQKPVAVTAKKPASDLDKQSVEESPSVRTTDDFGLPLVIVIEAPEVPKDIRGPSPPIEEEPEEAPKKSSGWW